MASTLRKIWTLAGLPMALSVALSAATAAPITRIVAPGGKDSNPGTDQTHGLHCKKPAQPAP